MSECLDSPALTPAPGARPLRWWMLVLVALLAVGAYANSVKNGFAFDDLAIVKNNPHVQFREWTTIWTDNYWPKVSGIQPDALYRPFTLWTYVANQALTPDSPGSFHLVNVALHALISVLTGILAWRLLGNRIVALVAGMLFAVHPLHTEVVANTVGRAELLATLWSLLALLVFLPQEPLTARSPGLPSRAWGHGLLVAACFLAAILSKETPATLLLALPAIDGWRWLRWSPSARPAWYRWAGRQGLRYYVPMAAAFGGYMTARVHFCGMMTSLRTIHHVVNPLVEATLPERIVTPFTLLAKYILLTFWPVNLSADYSSPSLLPTTNLLWATSMQPPVILGILLCVLAVLLAVLTWRKVPHIALLLVLFFLSYFLISNLIRIGTIFGERLFYWPSVFVLIMIAWAVVAGFQAAVASMPRASARLAVTAVAWLVLALPVGLMACRTWLRNPDWADNIALAISTARDNPNSGKACSWAGATLMISDNPDHVVFGKMLVERAIELSPDFVNARWELAKYYGLHNLLGESAIRVAQAARVDPGTAITRTAIPALVQDLKKADPASYMPVIESYYKEHPTEPAANLALAFAYHAQGDLDQALQYAQRALDLALERRPDKKDQYHEAGAEKATILVERGVKNENRREIIDGLDKFRLYLSNIPHSVEGHLSMADLLLSLDPLKFPGVIKEAQANIDMANLVEAHNSHVREVQSRLNRLSMTLARSAVTASVMPDSNLAPLSPSGVGP